MNKPANRFLICNKNMSEYLYAPNREKPRLVMSYLTTYNVNCRTEQECIEIMQFLGDNYGNFSQKDRRTIDKLIICEIKLVDVNAEKN